MDAAVTTPVSRRDDLPAILDALPALCAPYIDPDAPSGTPEWFSAVAAANLRDAAQLLDDCLRDIGTHGPTGFTDPSFDAVDTDAGLP